MSSSSGDLFDFCKKARATPVVEPTQSDEEGDVLELAPVAKTERGRRKRARTGSLLGEAKDEVAAPPRGGRRVAGKQLNVEIADSGEEPVAKRAEKEAFSDSDSDGKQPARRGRIGRGGDGLTQDELAVLQCVCFARSGGQHLLDLVCSCRRRNQRALAGLCSQPVEADVDDALPSAPPAPSAITRPRCADSQRPLPLHFTEPIGHSQSACFRHLFAVQRE